VHLPALSWQTLQGISVPMSPRVSLWADFKAVPMSNAQRQAARAPVLNDMPKKSSTTEAAGRFLGKLTNPQNPPSLKLAIFVSVVVLVTFLLWLLTRLNLL
jgi:hypothetical protein